MSINAGLVKWAALAAVLLLSAFVSVNAASAATKAANTACGGFEKKYLVASEFVQLNPGSRCRYFRMRFEVARLGSVIPKICYFAKVAGSDKKYGPFCSAGTNLKVTVPGPIESLSASYPVYIYVKLCSSPAECSH
jgi:hypothetical protein